MVQRSRLRDLYINNGDSVAEIETASLGCLFGQLEPSSTYQSEVFCILPQGLQQ